MSLDFDKILDECVFTSARSSGSGGQNVNKVETKVVLSFNVLASQYLSDSQKDLICTKLHKRISKDGVLQIASQTARSQLLNKRAATTKFIQLLTNAVKTPTRRVATKPTKQSIRKRLDDKKKLSEKKRLRSGM